MFDGAGADFKDFIKGISQDIIARGISIYGASATVEITTAVDGIVAGFLGKTEGLQGKRKLAVYMDYLQPDPIGGGFRPTLEHHTAVYNAPAQFVESILEDHIPTMQTLRNVEISSSVLIKN